MDESEIPRLRWRCRRGMRELDLLLTRWLDRGYPDSDANQRATFTRLLECEDDVLWHWCMGTAKPEDQELDELVERIRNLPA
ncbi:MAG: succinate dehydrogenase assembly factor 2 [Lysobacteraceae bacterium]